MFNYSELLLILFVALLVLGPKTLQNLIRRLNILLSNKQRIFTQLSEQWIVLKREQRLEENNKRAKRADESYKKK